MTQFHTYVDLRELKTLVYPHKNLNMDAQSSKFIITKKWKQIKCLSPVECANKMQDIHDGILFSH